MILVLERRKGHSAYPFSSFSLLFLLAVDSINELVGVNAHLPRPYGDIPPQGRRPCMLCVRDVLLNTSKAGNTFVGVGDERDLPAAFLGISGKRLLIFSQVYA